MEEASGHVSRNLPVLEPMISGMQHYAFPLVILESHPEAEPWILSNFIQLFIKDGDLSGGNPIEFFVNDYQRSPYLKVQRIELPILELMEVDLISFLEGVIEKEYYIYLSLDEYFVPNRHFFGNKNYSHVCLVHGYNSQTKRFLLLGYSKHGLFESTQISYKLFRKAFESVSDVDGWVDERQCIYLYQFRNILSDYYDEYPFSINNVFELTKEYRYSINSSERYSPTNPIWTGTYGMNTYKVLCDYIEKLRREDFLPDPRSMKTIQEHKNMMRRRVEYLRAKRILNVENSLMDRFLSVQLDAERLFADFLTFRNQWRYGGAKDELFLELVIKGLHNLELKEASLLDDFLETLDSTIHFSKEN